MGTSVSRAIQAHVRTFAAAAAALALALGLAPMAAFGSESVAGPLAGPGYEGDAQSASPNSDLLTAAEGPTLASALAGTTASIISADVALDSADPIVGSFTVDGLTYALTEGGVTLASVAGPLAGPEGEGFAEGEFINIALPSSAAYNDTTYPVTAVGPYAFYLSGATDVALPDSILSVDDRAFRSSDVARVEAAADNPTIASFDGCLYDSQLTSLLLIPEGRAGAVLLPETAEVVEPSKFSHCSLVDAISVEEGGAAFASWDGLLYDASGTTLLRVPAGATEITIRDGCTAIAAGALEGCAKLERINAPASVASISPDVFTSIPTVSLPAASVSGDSQQVTGSQDASDSRVAPMLASGQADGSAQAEGEAEASPRRVVASSQGLEAPLALPDLGSTSASPSAEASGSAPQLTAMVALSSADDDLPEVNPFSIEVTLPEGAGAARWQAAGFAVRVGSDAVGKAVVPADPEVGAQEAEASLQEAASQRAFELNLSTNGGNAVSTQTGWSSPYGQYYNYGDSITFYSDGRIAYSSYTITYSNPGCTFNCYSLANSYAGSTTRWWSGTRTMTSNSYVIWNVPITWSANGGYWNGSPSDTANKSNTWTSNTAARGYGGSTVPQRIGYRFTGWKNSSSGAVTSAGANVPVLTATTYVAQWTGISYTVAFDANGAPGVMPEGIAATYDQDLTLPIPEEKPGYRFLGWNTAADGSGTVYQPGTVRNLTVEDGATVTLYAQWERVDFSLGFDMSKEPSDEGYPGEAKPDQAVNVDSGTVPIEDPKRPGYVFEGWVIPNNDGTEAIDQDLVYQGDDGKWYVDASKLPDYAGDDGRVELTARWTSVISVDVPSSVTFYADLVTQGQESREGAAEGAFGQSKVANQSQVDLRVVGLESSAVETTDTTLGADSILKKADAATPSTSTQKLLSLYPSTKAWTAEELQDPDAVGGTKAAAAVDFDLDDILLEKSFKADDFTIAAGNTLNMGYRLNLSETGQQLDYDKLATLEEGQSASIANVSYTFAAPVPLGPTPSGDETDLLYVTVDEAFITANGLSGKAQPGTYGLADIKAAADDLSANGTASACYPLYKALLDKQVMWTTEAEAMNGKVTCGDGPYFQLKVDGVYLPLQLIGICQDTKSDGTGKSGLTFQMRDIYACNNKRSIAAGGGTFNTYMNSSITNSGGWGSAAMRAILRSTFWGYLPTSVQNAIVPVDKYQQLYIGSTFNSSPSYLQKTTGETIWLPSMYEVFGMSFTNYNESEALTSVSGYAPFQYMAYQGNAGSTTNTKAVKPYNGSANYWSLRSASRGYTGSFGRVISYGPCDITSASNPFGAAPAFCL